MDGVTCTATKHQPSTVLPICLQSRQCDWLTDRGATAPWCRYPKMLFGFFSPFKNSFRDVPILNQTGLRVLCSVQRGWAACHSQGWHPLLVTSPLLYPCSHDLTSVSRSICQAGYRARLYWVTSPPECAHICLYLPPLLSVSCTSTPARPKPALKHLEAPSNQFSASRWSQQSDVIPMRPNAVLTPEKLKAVSSNFPWLSVQEGIRPLLLTVG